MSKKAKVTLKLDLVFKKIFGDVNNTDILTDFLATLLEINPSEITDIEILNNEVVPDVLISKFSRLDLRINIEYRC